MGQHRERIARLETQFVERKLDQSEAVPLVPNDLVSSSVEELAKESEQLARLQETMPKLLSELNAAQDAMLEGAILF